MEVRKMKKTLSIHEFRDELRQYQSQSPTGSYYKPFNRGEEETIYNHMEEVWQDFEFTSLDIFIIWNSYKSLNDFFEAHDHNKLDCDNCIIAPIEYCHLVKKTNQEIIQDHIDSYNMNGTAFEVVSSEYNMKTGEREAITTYLVADFSNH